MSMNHLHFSDCAAFAPLLPLVKHTSLNEQELTRLKAHLATCASCRAELTLDAEVETALRRTYALLEGGRAPFSRAEIRELLPASGDQVGPTQLVGSQNVPALLPVIPAVPERQSRRWLGVRRWQAAALAALMVILILFGVFRLVPHHANTPAAVVLDRGTLTLTSISMVSASEGWAVGMTNSTTPQGVILHYHQGRWWQEAPLAPVGLLRSVFMVSASDGWIVGEKGTILHYGGGRWAKAQSPVTSALGSVFLSSATEGWAAGEALLHYQHGVWTAVNAPAHGFLSSLYLLTPDEGWAAGEGGTILHYSNGQWQAVTSPKLDLSSLAMIAANEGWAVGGGPAGNLLKYQDGQWSVAPTPDPQAVLSSLALASPEEGWAIGRSSASNAGLLLHYHDNQWTNLPSPTQGALLGITLVSSSEGWAVGSQGVLLHYLNGTWTSYGDPLPLESTRGAAGASDFTEYALHDISMISPDEGWAVGNTRPYVDTFYGGTRQQAFGGEPVILHYQQGHWTPQIVPDLMQHFQCGTSTFSCTGIVLSSISMVSAQEGWAAGSTVPPANVTDVGGVGILLHYVGGKWALVNLSASYLTSLSMRSATDGWMIGRALGPFGSGPSEVLHYDGHAWTPVNDPAFASFFPSRVISGGTGDIWITGIDYSVSVGNGLDGNAPAALMHYDGVHWSKINPQLANAQLYGLALVSPGAGWAVGALPNTNQHQASEEDGIIVQYQSGMWQVQKRLIRPFGERYFALTDVVLASPEEGWAIGNDGVILHYQSGIWASAQSPTGENLSSVSMVSASEGWAIGEQGTILHEQGGVWSLYQGT